MIVQISDGFMLEIDASEDVVDVMSYPPAHTPHDCAPGESLITFEHDE